MLTKADEEQLQRVCVNEETLFAARKLVPLAKARTKQGSGHHLAELATGLPAICAYLVSKQLNNDDVTLDNARHASCLHANDFNKALRTVSGVLESDLSPKKWKMMVSYDPSGGKYSAGQPLQNLRTPRRSSTKPLRDPPTRESMRKQRLVSTIEPHPSEAVDDVAPETPSKKRKLDVPSLTPLTKRRVIFPPITPEASHITYMTPTKSETKLTPATSSPLRRSARFALQQEVDASIEIDEGDEQVPVDVGRSLEAQFAKIDRDADEDQMEENYPAHRRFHPAYQDYKQWFTRDARVLRAWKEASVVHTSLVK